VSKYVDHVYEQSNAHLIQMCKNLKSFCVVVDSWTEHFTGINYCGIALRFVDDDYKLWSFILGCYPYDAPSHSAVHFRTFVDNKLQEYNLQLDISKFVVSDNEPKMLAAFRDKCTRIGCSDHYLNKQLQHGFESPTIHVNKNTVEKVNCEAAQKTFRQVKQLVTDVRRSHRRQQLSMKLQIYSQTRFSGAMIMLDIFRKVFYELPLVIINSNLMDIYNSIDKLSLDDICQFLGPFDEVINTLSEDKRPSLHSVIPLRQCLINMCAIGDDDSTAVAELKVFLAHRIKSAWLITTEHKLATILHPKMKNFENSPDEKDSAISELKLAFDKELSISSSSICLLNSNQDMSLSLSGQNTNGTTLSSKNKSLLTQCFDNVSNVCVKPPNQYQEIDDYLNISDNYNYVYHENDDIDVLSYWKEKKINFPHWRL
ncbi:unnamed protein product, partial [Adineta ricciae]